MNAKANEFKPRALRESIDVQVSTTSENGTAPHRKPRRRTSRIESSIVPSTVVVPGQPKASGSVPEQIASASASGSSTPATSRAPSRNDDSRGQRQPRRGRFQQFNGQQHQQHSQQHPQHSQQWQQQQHPNDQASNLEANVIGTQSGYQAVVGNHDRSAYSAFGGRRFQAFKPQTALDPRAQHQPARNNSKSIHQLDLREKLTLALQEESQDCPICLDSIHRKDAIWSCYTCYIPIHLTCLRTWISSCMAPKAGTGPRQANTRSSEPTTSRVNREEQGLSRMLDLSIIDPAPAPQDSDGPCWRCPACQHAYPTPRDVTKKMDVHYSCFCGRLRDPREEYRSKLAIPHSCNLPCSRKSKDDTCKHACPLSCHPGPCPPCQIPITTPCPCTKTRKVVPCHQSLSSDRVTCNNVCGKGLTCTRHTCEKLCHFGDCAQCAKELSVTCLCGETTQNFACNDFQPPFICEKISKKLYVCGHHSWEEGCTKPLEDPPQCPYDPSVLLTCPCGQSLLQDRVKCTDEVKCCKNVCNKQLDCGHACTSVCHLDAYPPCQQMITESCRCGSTSQQVTCEARTVGLKGNGFLCEKKCTALRSCARHECGTLCCPLAFLSQHQEKQRRKPKGQQQRTDVVIDVDVVDPEGIHDCLLPCPKMLSCGQHQCPLKDHKGPCPPCKNTSWQEIPCPCGRTMFEPPIRCGTLLECTYPCPRERACGHEQTVHLCHPETEPCPPCPHLTTKTCACGKKEVRNQRCSQALVACGEACHKLLSCGYHRCQKVCHPPGECEEPCTQRCGKTKKFCGHPCSVTCHAPSTCDESTPCTTVVKISCPCERIQQVVPCGVDLEHPEPRDLLALKCVDQCYRQQRNEAIADALGINALRAGRQITWPRELLTFYRNNYRTAKMFEEQLNTFMTTNARVLHMSILPNVQRQFVVGMASIYGMTASEIEQPSSLPALDLHKTTQSKIPTPLLSVAANTTSTSFDRLNTSSSTLLTGPTGVERVVPFKSAWDA